MKHLERITPKSIGASVAISLGVCALLKLGNPIGPVIFALGLISVCVLNLYLYTGKIGFVFEDNLDGSDLLKILAVNLISGYLIGCFIGTADPSLIQPALAKAQTWTYSFPYFLQSVFCGIVMYLAVAIYKKKSMLGILFGIPLFIFCGFQHCIANVITLGVAGTWNWAICLCIFGNTVGSILMWLIS